MDFKKIKREYQPIPFWSWNDRLTPEETKRQVRLMDEAGIGGYFMHARGGLLTEYMEDEWFENVDAATEEGAARGMFSWAYDENGWPSGFGGGKLLELGEDFLLKSIVYSKTEDFTGDPRTVLLERDGYTYYYNVNTLYVDLLNPEVTRRFIKEVHEVYKERCGNSIEGFFTDEPQLIREPGYPFSVVTFAEFESRYGYSLVDSLPQLFFKLGDYKKVRFDFWRMTTDLFSKNFFKQIYDWCEENGYKLTGHLVSEDNYQGIVPTTGASMPHYEYFHIPGMDWLGREIGDYLTARSVGSAAAQLGKKQVLSETFALTGHNVSHGELKRIYEWQLVRGINVLCTHLEGYTNRGIRKRDYPAAIYYQQPWWDDVKAFFDTVSRIGTILGEGKPVADVLLINPISNAWCVYDGWVESYDTCDEMERMTRVFAGKMRELEDKHVLYDLGDQTLMERHARVEGGRLIIGCASYSTVILPEDTMLFESTKRLLDEFVSGGGVLLESVDAIAASDVTEPSRLTYAKRILDDGRSLHYFVNSDPEVIEASFTVGDELLNPETGELYPFSGKHTFGPYESLILVGDGNARVAVREPAPEGELSLLGSWEVADASYNSITLDRCDYSFDGELVEKNGYVLNILPRINAKKRPVKLHQTYRFLVNELPEDEIFLVTETPEIFEIKVNGTPLVKRDIGDFRDVSFRRLPITELVKVGVNVVEFDSTICQSDKTFKHLDKSWMFETMTNCLSYDMEIEPIYIAGNFGVEILSDITELPRDAYRVREMATEGGFSFAIKRAPTVVDAAALDLSGYPEFAGTITLRKRMKITEDATRVKLTGRGLNSVHLIVDGKTVAHRMFGPYEVSLADFVGRECLVEVKIVNNLRNMQGPFHLVEGETYFANRNCFYMESNVFRHARGADENCHDVLPEWCPDVCLVHFGLSESAPITQESGG